MAKTSMEIVLSEDLKRRLDGCAKGRGTSLQAFVQEALYTYVEDMEDGALSDVALTEEGLEFLLPERDVHVGVDRSVFEAGRKTA